MESLNTIIELRESNRLLTITKSKSSVDIRITKFSRKDSANEVDEKIEEDVNIPITMDTYNRLVNEMFKICPNHIT